MFREQMFRALIWKHHLIYLFPYFLEVRKFVIGFQFPPERNHNKDACKDRNQPCYPNGPLDATIPTPMRYTVFLINTSESCDGTHIAVDRAS